MLYHLSEQKGLTVLNPKIPECALPMYENTTIKRVCFSDFIGGCLSALQGIPTTYYVYVPKHNIKVHKPSVKEVRDAKYTHEYWSLKDVEVKCIGVIKSDWYTSLKMYNTKKGSVAFFNVPFKWVEKYE